MSEITTNVDLNVLVKKSKEVEEALNVAGEGSRAKDPLNP